jgi:hypothetical protein
MPTAIIIIYKIELNHKEEVKKSLQELCTDIREAGEAFIYSPRSGRLMEFLTFLRENKIAYGTHFGPGADPHRAMAVLNNC